MTDNPHLIPQLDAYLKQTEPGYAIVIDAPWGAGKTYAINAWLVGKDHCYVSLFGVASIAGIEEALFNRLLLQSDAKVPESVTKMLDGVIKKFTGATIDLTSFHRQQVLKGLPRLLVFDDLERALMPAPALLAALNRFVEHEAKQVLLIANEAELEKSDQSRKWQEKDDYRKWREKVVGRTITLEPETDSALSAILASLAAGDAKDFMSAHRDLVITVFQDSETANLRRLRQSVIEFTELYTKLPTGILNMASGMRYLLASFLALSIAYQSGEIAKDDLLQQRQIGPKASRENTSGPPQSKLQVLRDRYKNNNFAILSGDALPGELARRLIGDGYVTAKSIDTALRDLAIFSDEGDHPWVTLWWWKKRDEAAVVEALANVLTQIDRNEITSPTIILHLWGIFTGLAKEGIIKKTEAELSQQIENYILALEADGTLPKTYPKERWSNAFLQESAHGLGYAYLETSEFKKIRNHLILALDRVYRAGDRQRVDDLLKLVTTDVEGFVQAISGRGDRKDILEVSREPVFSGVDALEAAKVFFSLPPNQMNEALRPFSDRLMRLTANANPKPDADTSMLPEHPERIFLKRLREEANHIADSESPIRAAQIRQALKWHLGFLDAQPDQGKAV